MKIEIPKGNDLPQPLLLACAPEWGSEASNHRQLLRTRLIEEARRLSGVTEIEAEAWQDLNRPPQASQIFCSISHTHTLGGFVLSKDPVGFDLETVGRVSKRVAERVSTSVEILNAPDAESLWVAKEAAYKCLQGKHQPAILSEIQILSWAGHLKGSFLYQAAPQKVSSQVLRGMVWRHEAWIFSLCFLNSSI